MTDRRRRVLVPFDLGSSLKAPYGYTQKMRAADRANRPPIPPPSRRDRVLLNTAFAVFYCLLIGGGVLGWMADQTWISMAIGVALGAASGVVLFPLAWAFAMVVRSLYRRKG